MTAGKVSWYRTQIVTLVLLAVAAGIVLWATLIGQTAAGQLTIGVGEAIILLIVGVLAGLSGRADRHRRSS